MKQISLSKRFGRMVGELRAIRIAAWLLSCVAIILTSQSTALAQQLYFADLFSPDFSDGSVRKVNADGSGLQTLVPTGGGLRSVALDQTAGKIYWTDVENQVIRRANLDGSDPQDLITSGLDFPAGIAVHHDGGKFYWGDQNTQQIWSANLDGSNPQLWLGTAFHRGLAIDDIHGKIYWSVTTGSTTGTIVRADLDGSNLETVVSSTGAFFKPATLTLDLFHGWIFWTDYVLNEVFRTDLDGTNQITIFFSFDKSSPRGIAVDVNSNAVFWGQDLPVPNAGKIMQATLQGDDPHDAVLDVGLVNSIAIPQQAVCIADITGNNVVNVDDLLAVINGWGRCNFGKPCPADIAPPPEGDMFVDVNDLLAVINGWGVCP